MNFSRCDGVLANDLVLPIYSDVVLYPIVGFAMLHGPVGFNILPGLAQENDKSWRGGFIYGYDIGITDAWLLVNYDSFLEHYYI